jgi:hypothetical protein
MLFGRTTRSTSRSELIAMITLRVLEPGEALSPEEGMALGSEE